MDLQLKKNKEGLLFYNKVENFNSNGDIIETISNERSEGKLDAEREARVLTDKILLVNNYEQDVSNVTLIGKNDNNVDTKLIIESPITVSIEEANIYYSEDLINWHEDASKLNQIIAYKIEIDKIEKGNLIEITSAFKISEGLEYKKK